MHLGTFCGIAAAPGLSRAADVIGGFPGWRAVGLPVTTSGSRAGHVRPHGFLVDRARTPAIVLEIIAQWRNRIQASFGEITGQMGLTRHGAHTFWGLLTRTAATIAAHTLVRACLAVA
jgi:hypothetical protein